MFSNFYIDKYQTTDTIIQRKKLNKAFFLLKEPNEKGENKQAPYLNIVSGDVHPFQIREL